MTNQMVAPKAQMVYSGQRVITSKGQVVTVAYMAPDGRVYAYDGRGGVTPVVVRCDAWGGEHDQRATNGGDFAMAA